MSKPRHEPIELFGISATQGARIQQASAQSFQNQSRPSGMLTAPGSIADETAKRLKSEFEANFSGSNIGRLLVTGSAPRAKASKKPGEPLPQWLLEDWPAPEMKARIEHLRHRKETAPA